MSSFDAEVISGQLPERNMRLDAAKKYLAICPLKLQVFRLGDRTFLETDRFADISSVIQSAGRSDYYSNFRDGATIYPRQFWFVEIVVSPRLGINPRMPTITTSSRAIDLAKKDYEDIRLRGQVESQFLFRAATGSELVPFGQLAFPLVVLPIEANAGKYRMIDSQEALSRGFRGLKEWLAAVEDTWAKKRGEKAAKMNVYQWLNYSRKLTLQSSRARFKVLYNASGKYLVSCVAKNEPSETSVDGATIPTGGLVADYTTFYWDTDNEDEAHYVAAILNAPIVDALIKPMQSRGDFGERHIVKKVLELPIPKYNPIEETHKQISALGKACQSKVASILGKLAEKYVSIGKIRQSVKRELEPEIAKIDELGRVVLLSNNQKQNLDDILESK